MIYLVDNPGRSALLHFFSREKEAVELGEWGFGGGGTGMSRGKGKFNQDI